jgi:hypothetical protein
MMQAELSQSRGERAILDKNRRYYDLLWADANLIEPQRFNTWPLVQSLLPASARQLEVAPGLRPRLPLLGTQFVDISAPALAKLRGRGAHFLILWPRFSSHHPERSGRTRQVPASPRRHTLKRNSTTNRFNYPADTKTQNGCPAGSASTYNGSTSSSVRS